MRVIIFMGLLLIFVYCIVYWAWKFICFFKKSCRWVKCPFRCEKCPLTEEEKKEELDRLREMLDQYEKEFKS